jgi:formylglycine-generating enzyme required for sulfatase activity
LYTYKDEPKGLYRRKTTEVGIFRPNSFGLYDLHGNVCEWCADDLPNNYEDVPIDRKPCLAKNNDSQPLLRGGSWFNVPGVCRSAYRFNYVAGRRGIVSFIGFRVVSVGLDCS